MQRLSTYPQFTYVHKMGKITTYARHRRSVYNPRCTTLIKKNLLFTKTRICDIILMKVCGHKVLKYVRFLCRMYDSEDVAR